MSQVLSRAEESRSDGSCHGKASRRGKRPLRPDIILERADPPDLQALCGNGFLPQDPVLDIASSR